MRVKEYKKNCPFQNSFLFLKAAEREGFEPPVPFGTMVFKTTAFDHSAISPKSGCKYKNYLLIFTNYFYFLFLHAKKIYYKHLSQIKINILLIYKKKAKHTNTTN